MKLNGDASYDEVSKTILLTMRLEAFPMGDRRTQRTLSADEGIEHQSELQPDVELCP
jgi:hypothetical protein